MARNLISILTYIFILQLFSSCGNKNETPNFDSTKIVVAKDSPTENISQPKIVSQNMEAKTFEVVDSLGKSHGWGYDLYVDGKKTIHQPIIPAVPGNNSFATESDAKKIGDLAATKMKVTGSLPTITPHDLDSLGIKR